MNCKESSNNKTMKRIESYRSFGEVSLTIAKVKKGQELDVHTAVTPA
jgi:hypothetical protein